MVRSFKIYVAASARCLWIIRELCTIPETSVALKRQDLDPIPDRLADSCLGREAKEVEGVQRPSDIRLALVGLEGSTVRH